MRNQVTDYLRAGYPGLYLVSAEEARIEAEMKPVAQTLGHKLYAWSITEGLVDTPDGHPREAHDPVQLIEVVAELPENTIVLLKDLHLFTEDATSVVIRQVRECLPVGKTKGKALVVVGCRLALPPELEWELVVIPFALPDKEQLGVVLDAIARSAKLAKPDNDEREQLLDAAYGLVVFPDCALSSYFAEVVTQLSAEQIIAATQQVAAACREAGAYAVVGTAWREGEKLSKSVLIIAPTGRMIERYAVQVTANHPGTILDSLIFNDPCRP